MSSSCRMTKNRLIFSQVSIFLCIYVYMYIHIYLFIFIYIPFSIYINIYNPSPTVACVYYFPSSRSHIFAHYRHVCFGVLYPLLPSVSLLFYLFFLFPASFLFLFFRRVSSVQYAHRTRHNTHENNYRPKVQLKRLLVYIYYNRGRGGAHVTSVCVSVMYIFILYDNSFL